MYLKSWHFLKIRLSTVTPSFTFARPSRPRPMSSTATGVPPGGECDIGSNQHQREELAAAYQALQYLGLSEGINNHLSTRAPARSGRGQVVLLFPVGLHWSEVTASRLVGVDIEDGNVVEGSGQPELTGLQIHCAIHREAIKTGSLVTSVFHLHTPYCTTLACLEDPTLQMVHRNSARFMDDVAYDVSYDGLAKSSDEGSRIMKLMGNKCALIMGNHGILVTGETVASAFNSTCNLERAAMFQVMTMATRRPQVGLSNQTSKLLRQQIMSTYRKDSSLYFDAIKRVIKAKSPHCFTD